MTSRRTSVLVRFTVGIAVLGLASACNAPDVSGQATPGTDITPVSNDLLPNELLGLEVTPEDISGTVASEQRSYVEATSLYSLRADELLQATLQVSRFNENADAKDAGFRRSLLSQIGGSRPRAVRVGKDEVYLTSGTKQQLAIWFRGEHLLILATREDFPRPKTLLRRALEVQP